MPSSAPAGWGRPFTVLQAPHHDGAGRPDAPAALDPGPSDQRITKVIGGLSCAGCGWMNCRSCSTCAQRRDEPDRSCVGRAPGTGSVSWSSSIPSLPQASLDAPGPQWLGPGVCPLCQQHRGFRPQALLRPLLPAALQHLARIW